MKLSLRKELPIIAIVLLPFVYLIYIWRSVPERVPTHFNFKGEIDSWGDKYSLIWMLLLLPVLTYVIMLVVPMIDPKKKIEQMGGKFYQLKFVLVTIMTVLAMFILYISVNPSMSSSNFTFIITGVLFIALGNYFKVIKPNYFIGIRTPWTLENEEVWKKTHVLGGKLFVIGGILIVIFSLVLPMDLFHYFFLSIVAVIILIPCAYSYVYYRELKVSK